MTLANEFQQKQQREAQQYQQQNSQQQGPKEHPEDTLIVCNILIGEDHEMEDVIPYANARQSIDPSTGQQHFINQIDTNIFENVWNTRDFFEVRWDGRPHRIKPGETRRMPRYLADHFAKYLIDYILSQREEKESLKGLVKNRLERKKLYDQIIVGVDSYYNGDLWNYERPGVRVEQQVQQLNQSDNALNLGEVPNLAMGYGLSDKAPEVVNSLVQGAEDNLPKLADVPKTRDEAIDAKSKKQLVAEATALGIELKGPENKGQIYDLITQF